MHLFKQLGYSEKIISQSLHLVVTAPGPFEEPNSVDGNFTCSIDIVSSGMKSWLYEEVVKWQISEGPPACGGG